MEDELIINIIEVALLPYNGMIMDEKVADEIVDVVLGIVAEHGTPDMDEAVSVDFVLETGGVVDSVALTEMLREIFGDTF